MLMKESGAMTINLFDRKVRRPSDNRDSNVNSKVGRIIQYYTLIIRKVIWDK